MTYAARRGLLLISKHAHSASLIVLRPAVVDGTGLHPSRARRSHRDAGARQSSRLTLRLRLKPRGIRRSINPSTRGGDSLGIPNAEKVALAILRDGQEAPVFVTPPMNRPKRYVRLSRVGGVFQNQVTDSAMITVSAYASDPADAADLANECRQLFINSRGRHAGGVWVRWWQEVSGPSNYPDPDVALTRYQFTGELRLSTN